MAQTKCNGKNCIKAKMCARYTENTKVFRIPSKNCIAQKFDIFIAKGVLDDN